MLTDSEEDKEAYAARVLTGAQSLYDLRYVVRTYGLRITFFLWKFGPGSHNKARLPRLLQLLPSMFTERRDDESFSFAGEIPSVLSSYQDTNTSRAVFHRQGQLP